MLTCAGLWSRYASRTMRPPFSPRTTSQLQLLRRGSPSIRSRAVARKSGPRITADSFSKVASGIQNVALVLGLAVGGWWALSTFVFQNPAFYERGSEALGYEPDLVKVELSLEPLTRDLRLFEVTLTVTNASKTLAQSLVPEDLDVLYFQPGQAMASRATYSSLPSTRMSFAVPPSESRALRYLAQFPRDGVYVVEVDVCRRWGQSCLAEKYIAVGIPNPSASAVR